MLGARTKSVQGWADRRSAGEKRLAIRISHELGNPLFVILGSSELLLRELDGAGLSPTSKRRVAAIHAQAKRAAEALKRIASR